MKLTPHYQDDNVTVYAGDCLGVLAELPDASVDSVVTDPPYGLEFMGKDWDSPWKRGDDINADATFTAVGMKDGRRLPRPTFTGSTNPKCINCKGTQRGRRDGTAIVKVCTCEQPQFPNVRAAEMEAFQHWCQQWATECLRILKPGGHILAFGGTRTWHRLAVAIEDAGFEIRDNIAWLYGSGFPKSLDVSKAIDKAAGAEREVIGSGVSGKTANMGGLRGIQTSTGKFDITAPATADAKRWSGWGTALKPAFEPVVVGRKPLSGTVAANVLAHGVGALNIDATRVPAQGRPLIKSASDASTGIYGNGLNGSTCAGTTDAGRWPSNVVIDETAAQEIDRQSGISKGQVGMKADTPLQFGVGRDRESQSFTRGMTDEGGASRYFPTFRYNPKAPTTERPTADGIAHPTVKPLDLMRWLIRLVTPPGGTVLEPFAGSGTTAEAAIHEHMQCIAIEREPDYLGLIVARLTKPMEIGFDFGEGA